MLKANQSSTEAIKWCQFLITSLDPFTSHLLGWRTGCPSLIASLYWKKKKKKKLYNYRLNSLILQVRKPRVKKLRHSVWAWVLSKEPTCQCRRRRSTPGSGWSLGEGKGKPTPAVFLPVKFHGQKSLAGYNAWRRKESDGTEQKHTQAWVRPLAPAMWAG